MVSGLGPLRDNKFIADERSSLLSRNACISDERCISFSYDENLAQKGKACTLYDETVSESGWSTSSNGAIFFDRDCFECTECTKSTSTSMTSSMISLTTTISTPIQTPDPIASTPIVSTPTSSPNIIPSPDPTPDPTPDPNPDPTPDPTPEPTPDPTPEPTPDATPTSTDSETSTSPTFPDVPTCTPNSFLLRVANSDPALDNTYARVPSTYSPITAFTDDPTQASVFFVYGSNRLGVGDCGNPQAAVHWNGDNNPYTNFWFETQDYIGFYGDEPAACQIQGSLAPISCQLGSRSVLAFCTTGAGAQFISLLASLSDPSVSQNGQTCIGLDLVVVPLPNGS